MRKMNERVRSLIEQGVGRRTAYRRIRVSHCSTCTCEKNLTKPKEPTKVEDFVLTEFPSSVDKVKRSSRFDLCPKHGSMKMTCGC